MDDDDDEPPPTSSHGSTCFHAPSRLSLRATNLLAPAVLAGGGWIGDGDRGGSVALTWLSRGPAGGRRVDGDGNEDEVEAGDVGGGVACVSVKSSLRFTFWEAGRSDSAAGSDVSRCFPVGVGVGVRSCPARKRALAICSGLRFFRGEGFVGSWGADVGGFALRRVTFPLMARGVSVGSSASEIGVVGRECRFFAEGEVVNIAGLSWLQALSGLSCSCGACLLVET